MAIDGTYQITVKIPLKPQEGTLILKTEGEALSGCLSNATDQLEFTGGKAYGNEFEFTLQVKGPIGMIKFIVSGTVEGDKIFAMSKTPFGRVKIEGERL
jgi:hypothetical protein